MKVLDNIRTPSLLQTLQLIAQSTKTLENCAANYGDIFTMRVMGLKSPTIVFLAIPKQLVIILLYLHKS